VSRCRAQWRTLVNVQANLARLGARRPVIDRFLDALWELGHCCTVDGHMVVPLTAAVLARSAPAGSEGDQTGGPPAANVMPQPRRSACALSHTTRLVEQGEEIVDGRCGFSCASWPRFGSAA
jgi:hypothetical protein